MTRPAGPHVFIATPCYGGLVTQAYMESVVGLMAAAPGRELALTLAMLGQDALITRCRNTLVSRFLYRTSATHLLFVDGDIGFTPDAVFRLLDAALPVSAGLYPLKRARWTETALSRLRRGESPDTAALDYVGADDPADAARGPEGFVPARYAGTGFMMIARPVIEQLVQAHPELTYRHLHADAASDATPQHALFDCLIDRNTGTYLSEDYAFCQRWREQGGRVWIDTRSVLTHTGTAEFRGDPSRRFEPPMPHAA
ncbi:hypothetical protein [Rhizosaccharibacter radicis]|uniref:Glycosyltransferase n=1 Tax=Rhizosaccharibacter radicis TaxID=2782605 RepID=A0ABT1VYS5_9PROT|nr:hypothetical protein [Acetobacteraceae bacterium KSS12]